jgi:hypothetical protein
MSNTEITYLVAAAAVVLGLAAFVALIAAPAWASYSRTRERIGAAFLSLYVLIALVGLGVATGGLVIWFWDRFT